MPRLGLTRNKYEKGQNKNDNGNKYKEITRKPSSNKLFLSIGGLDFGILWLASILGGMVSIIMSSVESHIICGEKREC